MSDATNLPGGPPSAFQQSMRQIGHTLPYTGAGKKIASLMLRLAGGTKKRGYDVTVFETQAARLYPFDNISEKRVYITPQFWDPEERAFLKARIRAHDKRNFIFLDVGANAGLYSLWTKAACDFYGKHARIVAVEPDPLMRARLEHNLSASSAEAQVLDWAITREAGTVHLQQNEKSRGMNKLADTAGTQTVAVEGHPLADVFAASGMPRLDAMKIDIEGHEHAALSGFFEVAQDQQLPAMIIMETSHEDEENSALKLCLDAGYAIAMQNRLNTILLRN